MRTRLIAVCIAVLALFPGCCTANLLQNPSFENIAPGTSYANASCAIGETWRYFSVNGAGGTVLAVTPGQDGNVALKLSRASTAGDSGVDLAVSGANFAPVLGKTRYQATVWAKSDTGGSLSLTLAAHGSYGEWLGQQLTQVFPLTSTYQRCTMEYVTPAATVYMNFAMRVSGIGTIYVDNCSLDRVPTITYPSSETVDSFKPTIAFASVPHTAYSARISSGGATVWDSGTVNSTAYSFTFPVNLQPSTQYQVEVSVCGSNGWTPYCLPSAFMTPTAPIVKIASPVEADLVRGPTVTLKWQAESLTAITSQTITIDGRSPTTVPATLRSYSLWGLTAGVHTVTVSAISAQGIANCTRSFYVRVTPASSGTIYVYDLRYMDNWDMSNLALRRLKADITNAVCSLQGMVNRSGPQLYVYVGWEDPVWLNRMRESGNWLAKKSVVTVTDVVALFNTFRSYYNGVVLWDSNVCATLNVATTVAGADDLIPMSYDTSPGSLYNQLVTSGPQIPVQTNLVNKFTGSGVIWGTSIPSTGSKKDDAYIWARTKYLETGKCNPGLLMYAIDAYDLLGTYGTDPLFAARDYMVQNKGFTLDLSVWGDEKPIDDPNQTLGLDLSTHRSILAAAAVRASGMVQELGFIPFSTKYSNFVTPSGVSAGGTHDPVSGEWENAKWISNYNTYLDVDGPATINGSIHSHFPFPDRLVQNPRLSWTDLRKRGYIDSQNNVSRINYLNFYIGDYDSSGWISRLCFPIWDDTNRGSLPLSWGFNPNVINRIAGVYEYYNRTRTDNDSFIAGDSGAGYLNPSYLLTNRLSGLPSARDIWIKHNLDYFRRTNTKITGFIINGDAGTVGANVDDMYSKFSTEGIFTDNSWYPQGNHLYGTMPALVITGPAGISGTLADDINNLQSYGSSVDAMFLCTRTILQTPTYLKNVYAGVVALDATIPWALTDTRTYTALAGCQLGQVPDHRATYTFDTIPNAGYAGCPMNVSIGARNDGWINWTVGGIQTATLLVRWLQGSSTVRTESFALPRDVASSEGIVLGVTITPPTVPGDYTISYEIASGGVGFSSLGDYGWEKPITITADTTPPTVPGIPVDAGAFMDNVAVAFSWAASSDADSGIDSYVCQVGTTQNGNDVFDGNVGNVLTKTITGSFGNRYYCRVRARDTAGNLSDWSSSSGGISVVQHTGVGVGTARSLADLDSVGLSSMTVTAIFDSYFYIEEQNRIAGIMVKPAGGIPAGLAVGQTVDIGGLLRTTGNETWTSSVGERYVDATVKVVNGP